MNRRKINDYFEFPLELDMAPYVEEDAPLSEDYGLCADVTADRFKYSLKGESEHHLRSFFLTESA
jgi:hypothetical protein